MKNFIRILALLLVTISMIGCFAGCGGDGEKNSGTSSTDIQISYWRSGLDDVWLSAIIDAFNAKHPEYHVYYKATADFAASTAAYGLADVDTVDLYMSTFPGDTKYAEPLNDILQYKHKGESKTLGEKFHQNYLDMMEYPDGNIYSLSYSTSAIGIVYNKELFQQAGIEVTPRTTDELIAVCSKLADMNITPTCHFTSGGYYWKINELWFAQYEGLEAYNDFLINPTKEKMLTEDGRYETLKVNQKLLTPENVMPGSNVDNHVSVQTKFLNGKAAMMVNGSWLSTEMLNSDKMDNFAMMRNPVISAIKDKCTTVQNDQQLRSVVSAIDSITDGEKTEADYKQGDNYVIGSLTVSAADWEKIKEARTMCFVDHNEMGFVIPNYSNAKEGAKEFVKFFYSDEAYKIYQSTAKLRLPMEMDQGQVDTTGWNGFQLNQYEIHTQAELCVSSSICSRSRLFTDGGAWTYGSQNYDYRTLMCTNNESDRITAEDAWKHIQGLINDNYADWEANIKN